MDRTRRIAELEQRLHEQRTRMTLLAAEIAGTQAELEALRHGLAETRDLASLDRTEAIVSVLASSPAPLTTREIQARLAEAGRDDSSRLLHATLSYLDQHGRVVRVRRGVYAAP